ncbi:MAG: cytochrome P450, partial [Bradymonadaceae bacterium]
HLEFIEDQIDAYWTVIDEYGPVVRLWIGPFDMFLIAEPDLIEEILVDKPRTFHKDVVSKELDILLGRGLLITDGDLWRQQRKLVAPPLQRRQIAHYAYVMVAQTERMIEQWEDGQTVRFDRQATELTLRIVVQTLFDLEMEGEIEEIAEAVDDTMEFIDQLRHSAWRFVPDPIPTPKERQFEEAKAHLDEIIYELIERRRRRDEPGDDLLYRLLQATDEAGHQMSDEQLRDEVITLFLAGHETTAMALTYAWYLVARHPRVEERLQAEIDDVVGDDRPGVEHARELPYTEAVFKESMRLFPPAWAVGRQPVEDVEIGDYTIPEGAQVIIPQCIVHRDERWFDDPDAFRPERWLGDLEDELSRFGYFPFGGGPRICVGNHFAEMEGILAIATIAKHCTFDHVASDEMATYTSITQRPEEAVELQVRFR